MISVVEMTWMMMRMMMDRADLAHCLVVVDQLALVWMICLLKVMVYVTK